MVLIFIFFKKGEVTTKKINICMDSPWLNKTISELTIEDALAASNEGFCIVCGDGKPIRIMKEK